MNQVSKGHYIQEAQSDTEIIWQSDVFGRCPGTPKPAIPSGCVSLVYKDPLISCAFEPLITPCTCFAICEKTFSSEGYVTLQLSSHFESQ